jgi:hypothetical protein
MQFTWRDPKRAYNTRFAFEIGRSKAWGRWFAWVNIRGKNYWIRRY